MMVVALQNELNKEKEKSSNYRKEFEDILKAKEDLETTLSMSRHNNIELTEKLEDEIAKVAALEDMRLNDLKYIVTLENDIWELRFLD